MISAMNNVLGCAGQGDLVTRHNRGTGARDLLYCGPIARLTLWMVEEDQSTSPHPSLQLGRNYMICDLGRWFRG